MVKLYVQSVRRSAPCSDGARLVVIGEQETQVFEGTGDECAQYLQCLPVGVSVAVRHSDGIRSCMNKPPLWADCQTYL